MRTVQNVTSRRPVLPAAAAAAKPLPVVKSSDHGIAVSVGKASRGWIPVRLGFGDLERGLLTAAGGQLSVAKDGKSVAIRTRLHENAGSVVNRLEKALQARGFVTKSKIDPDIGGDSATVWIKAS